VLPGRLATGGSSPWHRVRAAAAAAALLGAAVVHAADPTGDLKELRGRIQRLQQQLAESEESKSEAADALRTSERAISETRRRLFELAARQRSARGELARIQARSEQVSASARNQQDLLARQLREQYLSGESGPVRLVLSLQDPSELARRVHYLALVSRARAQQIAALKRDLTQLGELEAQARDRQAELERLQAEQARSQAELEQERRTRQAVLAKVSQEIGRQRREIGTLKRDEERLSKLVQRLARELTPRAKAPRGPRLRNEAVPEPGVTGSFRKLKGSLRLPVRGELANQFGSPREGSGIAWKGLLIRARPGAEVRAVAPGRVVFADWLRGFGNLLILDHGDGYLSLYAYNEALLRQVGDRVGSGEPIATVGGSGGSEQTGLYFEIRHQGRPIDPLSWAALK
jgi:septal ring factor EnvC (AmiA/AmiB activator)